MVRRGEGKMDGRGTPFHPLLLFFKRVAKPFTFNPPALVRVCVPGRNGGGRETGKQAGEHTEFSQEGEEDK